MIVPARRYPVGPITPYGSTQMLAGNHPAVALTAYDGSIVFDLMGGRSVPDPAKPEVVHIKRDGLKGLIPPWKTIDQKGATEDGTHFIDALYDPIEITAQVTVIGRDARYHRAAVRDLIASIDVKQTSELSWFTNDMGKWWSNVRWFKTAPDNMMVGGQVRRQDLTLVLRGDNGFWRSSDSVVALSGTGFANLFNAGDQPMYPRFTCFGPGTFRFADGPGSTKMVEFGPLLANQVVQIRSDPRKRTVVDLTQIPPSPQDQQQFAAARADLLTLTQVLGIFQSIFGILGTGQPPPQGNMYSLLKGRFSDNSAMRALSPGNPLVSQSVKVEISGGGTCIVAGTPLRRLPY